MPTRAFFYCLLARMVGRCGKPSGLSIVPFLDKKELIEVSKENDSHPLVVGHRVFDRLLNTEEIVQFGDKKYLLLQLLLREIPLEEAADRVGLTLEQAADFRDSDKAQKFLQDRMLAKVIAQEAQNSDRWWVRAEGVMQGEIKLSKGQTETFKEIGKRVVPISEGHGTTKIEINIDPGAVKAAFVREKAIEAELSR